MRLAGLGSGPFLAALVVAVMAGGTLTPGAAQPAARRTLSIAAASDLQAVFPELAIRFERDTRINPSVSFGSSGNFFAQIQNGAPFDVFFSADIDYPRQLVSARLAEADSLYEYATGHIVVWTRKASGIDVRSGLKALPDARVRRIAIANPQFAPYGRAAVAAMQSARVYDAVKDKLVLGDNISQAAQLADSGNADVGILALSLARGPALSASGTYSEIPANLHPPIQQAAVVISASKVKAAARQFIDSLKQADAARILERFGFIAPSVTRRLGVVPDPSSMPWAASTIRPPWTGRRSG
jgi:molybdate transport system substrate-binding protein